MHRRPYILVCTCGHTDLVPEGKADEILNLLKEKGISCRIVADLCGLTVKNPEGLNELKDAENLVIIACYPRSITWILHRAGIERDGDGKSTKVFNMRTCTPEEILSSIEGGEEALSADKEEWGDSWRPWYPVIDYDRCTSCGQCADFCLFGVYEKGEDGKVKVVEPSNCKDKCPACARICPSIAIIFPKLAEGPINGDEILNEEEARAMVKVNMDEVLGDNIYAALAERRRKARKRRLLKKQNEETG